MSPDTEIFTSLQENEAPAPDTALPIAEISQYLTELHERFSEDANIRIEIAAINPATSDIIGIREWWVMGDEPEPPFLEEEGMPESLEALEAAMRRMEIGLESRFRLYGFPEYEDSLDASDDHDVYDDLSF